MIPIIGRPAPRINLQLPPLHPQQALFVNDPHRVVVASCGTKTGKTFGLSIWLLRHAWNNYQTLNWWTAPTLRQARTAFNIIGRFIPEDRVKTNRNEMTYSLRRLDGREHSLIEFRSADNPSSLRGEGVAACVVDEAGYWGRASYESVWTTLTRTRGLLRVISTPKGRNWFYDEWVKGTPQMREKHPEYASYRLPTASNPFIPRESIEEARRNMPEDVFRQEFEAEFLDESAGVFRNITACQTAQMYSAPLSGHRYAIGVDWAKHNDYSVFVVGDLATRAVCHIERHNQIDWSANINKARVLANRWNNASLLMDSTGVGDVPFDELSSVYPRTYGYSISTNAAKVALIQKLQFAFEGAEIAIPKASDQNRAESRALAQVLEDEIRMYSVTQSAQGRFQYSAPEGYHDDCVIALALLNWQFAQPTQRYAARSMSGV